MRANCRRRIIRCMSTEATGRTKRKGLRVRLAALALTAIVSTVAAGCGGNLDKTGGGPPAKPVVLTLVAHDDDEQEYAPFVAAVARLSGGALRINVLGNWGATQDLAETFVEGGIVSAVRSGKAQLGVVAVRVWDTLGVRSFQALVAPFLVDSLALELRALQMPHGAEALAGLRRSGVVGVALLPGRLRRPLGLTRPLLGPADYRGARIAIRPGGVAGETFRALGARPGLYIPGTLPGFDGVEIDPFTVSAESFDQGARELTGNVVLWPKPWTIIMNPAAFAHLTHAQKQIILAAGREAQATELPRIVRDQQIGVTNLCRDGLPFATATVSDLAALRSSVRPVYRTLERDAFTRRWIAVIRRLRLSFPPDVAQCHGR
jgi:TRAP-type C4-dicarboxylate transport system substrate-binding protein